MTQLSTRTVEYALLQNLLDNPLTVGDNPVPMVFENEDWKPRTQQAFVRAGKGSTDDEGGSLSRDFERENGTMELELNTPIGQGALLSNELEDTILATFPRYATFKRGDWTVNITGREKSARSTLGEWRQQTVTLTYIAHRMVSL